MAHNSQGSLLSASTQAQECVILPVGETYSRVFSSIEEPIYLQAYGLTGDPETDYIALECAHLNADGSYTYVDYAPAGVQRFNRLTNNAIIRERGKWRLRRVGNSNAFIAMLVGSNIHELPDDYWAERFRIGRGEGVTSVTGQNTPSINLTANPTTGAVNVFGNVNLSPDSGNLTSIRPNGVYSRGPLNGDIVNAVTTVSDTSSIDHTLSSNNLSSVVRVSGDSGNVVEIRAGGLYVPAAAAAPIQAVNGSDSTTWDAQVTTSGSTVTVSGAVKFSPAANNQASDDGQGVWVPRGAGLTLDTSGVQTATFTPSVTLSSGVLRISGDARVSATAGNQLSTQADGLYVAPAAAGVSTITLNDTATVDFTQSATNGAVVASAVVRISPTAGNVIVSDSGGIYAPTPVSSLVLTDTSTIDFTSSGSSGVVNASAAVKISATGGNIITANADGLYATAAGTVNATRLATGIARFCDETQMRNATNENAVDGGYVVTTQSLQHFVHCNRADSPVALNCVRVGLAGFSTNNPNVFGVYLGNNAFGSSQAYGRAGGISSNAVVATRDGLSGSDALNCVHLGGRVEGAAFNNSVTLGLRYESSGIGAHLGSCQSIGDLAVDGNGVIGDFEDCTFLGTNGAISHSLGSTISANYANLNLSNGAWPVASHGLSTGQYHVCVANTTGGNKGIVVWAADANNLIALGTNLSTYSGTTTLRKVAKITNSSTVGNGAVISANNQIKLGNDNVTRIDTNAGCSVWAQSHQTYSDESLKKDIVDFVGIGNDFDNIKPSAFTWKSSEKRSVGFIAQNVSEFSGDCVERDEVTGLLSLNTNALIAVMWAEIKSLRSRVKELESR